MDYKAKYEEALDRAKSFQEKYGGDYAGFIFPELAESEDERIRQQIEQALIEHDWGVTYLVSKEDCLAWLERQKGPQLTEEVKEWKKDLDRLLKERYGQNSKVATATLDSEKQKEQDWNKKPCLTCDEYDKGYKQGYTEGCTTGYNKAILEQPKQEWSEEDEDNLKAIIRIIEDNDSDWKELTDWLKSLRTQPKRDGGDDYNKGYIKGRADAIKEFDDIPHWKPSEEQMNSLNYGINALDEEGYDASASEIKELYEQLKKLMED